MFRANRLMDLVIHPFCEGNTRSTAVFIIKYLKTFGFFEVDKVEYGKLMNRLSIFKKETQPRKAIHMTLVSANGFLDGKYASVFQNIITGEQLFQ